MDKYTAFRIEVSLQNNMVNDAVRDAIVEAMKRAGREVVIKTTLIADPNVASASFEQWSPDGWKPVPLDDEEPT